MNFHSIWIDIWIGRRAKAATAQMRAVMGLAQYANLVGMYKVGQRACCHVVQLYDCKV